DHEHNISNAPPAAPVYTVSNFNSLLGSVYIRNAHANARNRPQGKEEGAPFGRAKQATRDAAMRAISGIPLE
ncbi:hypothetical protein, partial [Burkholderia ubonensis]|uniref:hypothetical protein n=1 Tax=Burkholderia ubonensis TaxID=101571 RepID=UPI001E4ABFFA